MVTLYDTSFGRIAWDDTNFAGAFEFPALEPGSYLLSFWYIGGTQWYPGQVDSDHALPVAVRAGELTDITEPTLPTGVFTGTLTDSTGAPVAWASVYATGRDNGNSGYGQTDEAGHYRLEVMPGAYTVAFSPEQRPFLYAPGTLSFSEATLFQLAVGQTVTVDQQLPATGRITGRYTAADGTALAGYQVQVQTADSSTGGWARTGPDGSYTVENLYVGSYLVSFADPDWVAIQYAHGKLTPEQADRFTVSAGADTVVNDSALPTGTVKVTARDAVTGKKITNFCAYADQHEACTTTGVVLVTGVRAGSQSVAVYTNDGHYYSGDPVPVTVTGNHTTTVQVTLKPGATITVVVKDRATGAPVADACLAPMPTGTGILPDGFGYCADAQGVVRVGPLTGGSYTLYARGPGESGYGAQWVGATGGVGDPSLAAVVKVKDAKFATGPTVLLDPAGSITGTVTDPAGHPVPNAVVGITSFEPGAGPTGPGGSTDAQGRYTVSGLGPYAWPLLVATGGYPWQWTGGVARRTDASRITVPAGGTATADLHLVAGVTLSGTVRGPGGAALTAGGRVIAYDPVTRDVVGVTEVDAAGGYRLPLVGGGQKVKLRFESYQQGQPEGWYGGASRDTATVVTLRQQNLTLDLTIG
jgi:hypothetical protein